MNEPETREAGLAAAPLQPGQVSLDDELYQWHPPCVERYLPGAGPVYIHGYTGADAAKWKRAAANLAAPNAPSPEQFAVAQVLWVCRTQPGGEHHTFQVNLQSARGAVEKLTAALPGKWIEQVCFESDLLCLQGYLGPVAQAGLAGVTEAAGRLGEQLSDEGFWMALSALSLRLYGVPLTENGQPLAEVLSLLTHEQQAQQRLLEGLLPLATHARGPADESA